jgi:RimJ/RimL family protein N-acetyltransferase
MTDTPRRYDTAYGTLTLRPERADDDPFLFSLFCSHAGRQLQQSALPAAAVETMLDFQYRAQSGTHRKMFPDAVYSIIESDGAPVGRLIEQDEGDRVYFVDFALVPHRQAKGLGTAFIEMVAGEWAQKGRAARVEVFQDNVHSLKLCAKLGFVRTGESMGYVNLLRAIPPSP